MKKVLLSITKYAITRVTDSENLKDSPYVGSKSSLGLSQIKV